MHSLPQHEEDGMSRLPHPTRRRHFRPPTGVLPTCTLCHKAGAEWVFTTPSKTDCQTCHTPCGATTSSLSAARCHPARNATQQAGQELGVRSPASCRPTAPTAMRRRRSTSSPRPGTLKPCSQCHPQAGVSWKFSHPGSRADCTSCHTRPVRSLGGPVLAVPPQDGRVVRVRAPVDGRAARHRRPRLRSRATRMATRLTPARATGESPQRRTRWLRIRC